MAWRSQRNHEEVVELGASIARQAAASMAGLLAARDMTRTELATAMGVSTGRVSQILSGDENLTVRSLAAAALALQAHVEIRFHDTPSAGKGTRPDAGDPSYGPTSPSVPFVF
ncbi:helix-turn-helix transcriptional regulator [Streptomyces sp. MI02-7b]|uniref:helix-turn-helix transcriptional regulator n=1 Tax=Streptomyces sp. MI02-7b TaxID=462941 RepID=UPI0029B26B6F|nr:helix-turn-helix transcriptional regulator [Streptomyces sp. MI02-7b]MDX3078430.1 helix-turn-helix transcriptional regulator [Streptomyces sp. MI02-7b]